VIFEQTPGVHTSGAVGRGEITSSPTNWAAENIPAGIFTAHGPNVPSAGKIDPISILDIAPTILYSMDEAIPENFEGSPVELVNVDHTKVSYRDSLPSRGTRQASTDEDVQDRLENLGYLE